MKRKSFSLPAFAAAISLFSGTAAITSGIFLKNYNNSLVVQKQNTERKIDVLERKNENCKEELIILQGNDRIAKAAGKSMTYDPKRITVIQNGEKKKSGK